MYAGLDFFFVIINSQHSSECSLIAIVMHEAFFWAWVYRRVKCQFLPGNWYLIRIHCFSSNPEKESTHLSSSHSLAKTRIYYFHAIHPSTYPLPIIISNNYPPIQPAHALRWKYTKLVVFLRWTSAVIESLRCSKVITSRQIFYSRHSFHDWEAYLVVNIPVYSLRSSGLFTSSYSLDEKS